MVIFMNVSLHLSCVFRFRQIFLILHVYFNELYLKFNKYVYTIGNVHITFRLYVIDVSFKLFFIGLIGVLGFFFLILNSFISNVYSYVNI